MMAPEEMAPIAVSQPGALNVICQRTRMLTPVRTQAVKAAAALSEPSLQAAQESAFDAEEDETPREPKTKQTKAEKAYNKRKLLLES